jgi:hypothetical protein
MLPLLVKMQSCTCAYGLLQHYSVAGSISDNTMTLLALMPDASLSQLLQTAHAAQQQLPDLLQTDQQDVSCTVQATAGPHVVSVQICSQVRWGFHAMV